MDHVIDSGAVVQRLRDMIRGGSLGSHIISTGPTEIWSAFNLRVFNNPEGRVCRKV